jgi:hypothetical protein
LFARLGLSTPRAESGGHPIGTNGWNVAFVDQATGTNYLRADESSPCALIWENGKHFVPSAARLVDGRLTLHFPAKEVEVDIKTEIRPAAIIFTDNQINIVEDLKWLKVCAADLKHLIGKRSSREEDRVRASIFHDTLFRKIREVRKWAEHYKDA